MTMKPNWLVENPNKFIYVAGVFNHPKVDFRVVGFFNSESEANLAVKNNEKDIHEDFYKWAVVERFVSGFYPVCLSECAMWYQWSDKKKKYIRKSRIPDIVKKLVVFNLSIS